MGEPKNNYETLWRKPDRKDYIMYDSIYMKFLEKAKSESEEAVEWSRGTGAVRGTGSRWARRVMKEF